MSLPTTLYMGLGFASVWAFLWVVFYLYELRSPREDELGASFIIATATVVVSAVIVLAMLLVAWAIEAFAPIFG